MEQKGLFERLGPLLSFFATLLAGGLAAYATIQTASIQQQVNTQQMRTNRLISKNQEETKHLLATMSKDTQLQIIRLQLQSQIRLASAKNSIERVKVFRDLITKLNSPKESSLALLALWQLYPKKTERSITVAAALSVGNDEVINTLAQLGEEVHPFLKKALRSKNPAVRTAANQVLGADISDATNVLIHQILRNKRAKVFDEPTKELIRICKSSQKSRGMVEKAFRTAITNKKQIYAYVLLKSGNPNPFQKLLQSSKESPQFFAYNLLSTVEWGDYDKRMWPTLLDLTIAMIESPDIGPITKSAGFRVLADHGIKQEWIEDLSWIPSIQRKRFIRATYVSFTRDQNEFLKYRAIIALGRWAPRVALLAIATMLQEDTSIRIIGIVDELIEGKNYRHVHLRKRFRHLEIPAARSGTKSWQAWSEKNKRFILESFKEL